MAKTLNLLSSGNNVPFNDGGIKFSKTLPVEKIEEYREFKELFRINEDVLERIKKTMKETGFDKSQPVHIWHTRDENGNEHWYLIDGYTRFRASRETGITRIPVYEHDFADFTDAYRYVLSLQVNRRNLESDELMKNVSTLLETPFVKNYEGDKALLIADTLGKSRRTVQRAISIEKNATDEIKEKLESGKVSVYEAYNQMKETKKRKRKENLSQTVTRVSFYILSLVEKGERPETILGNEAFKALLKNPSGFLISEEDLEGMCKLGFKEIKGDKND